MMNYYHRFPNMVNPQCDVCGVLDRAGWSAEEAQRIAEEDGWKTVTTPDGTVQHICPRCQQKEEKKEHET